MPGKREREKGVLESGSTASTTSCVLTAERERERERARARAEALLFFANDTRSLAGSELVAFAFYDTQAADSEVQCLRFVVRVCGFMPELMLPRRTAVLIDQV